MVNDDADEGLKELFESLSNRYQNNLETKMRRSKFALLFELLVDHISILLIG